MLNKYVVELLKDNTRVIIPDFGAFMTKFKPGVDKDSKDLADRIITFNDFLKYNDGLLINHIIKTEKINKEEATKKVKEYIKTIEKEFNNEKPFTIEGLGNLFVDDKGSIKFSIEGDTKSKEPKKPVEKETVKTKDIKEEPKKVTVKKEDKKPIETKKEDKTQVDVSKDVSKILGTKKETPIPKKDEKVIKKPIAVQKPAKKVVKTTSGTKKVDKKIIIWSAAGVVLIAVIILAVLKIDFIKDQYAKITKKDQVIEKEPVVEKKSIALIDTLTKEKKDSIAAIIQDTVKEKEVVKEEPKPKVITKKYYVVAGCFKVENNAYNFVKTLNEKGYNSEMFAKRSDFYTVSFNAYDTWKEAVNELNIITNEKGQQAWILYY
ncbi:MAG: SPOR domain-containing protein [Bacteroidales bacterium]|nr:SPOR domain-containing protein [Bacteroidales bacterium]